MLSSMLVIRDRLLCRFSDPKGPVLVREAGNSVAATGSLLSVSYGFCST